MDVVLRTPHGEGEISLVVDSTNVTLGDVVERVVGQPAPPVVYVDGRAASSTTNLSEAGVVVGSLIDTDDATLHAPHGAPVEIRQLAGQGCGTTAPLLPGDYRIGPGRRIHANELTLAPVDDAVMELRVADDGRVMVRGRTGVQLIDGPSVSPDRFVVWADEPLSIEGRIFELVRPVRGTNGALGPGADEPVDRRATAAGTITFHRPSISDTSVELPGGVPGPTDALAFARTRSAQLWQRRGVGPGEFSLPLGLHVVDDSSRQPGGPSRSRPSSASNGDGSAGHLQTVEAVLERGRGLAFVGRADFTRSAASGLVVLAATLYGPADLDIVVATTPDRANAWEWVKWLPHSRVGGHPDVMLDDRQLRSWLRRRSRSTSATVAARRTLMVVDDENAWHERTSPLREIVTDESAPISFVVLTTHLHDVPTLCETVVSERSHGTAHIELRQRRRRFDDVHTFVVTTDLATEVARRLAPLDDAAIEPAPAATTSDIASMLDLHGLGAEPRPSIAHRWNVATHDETITSGHVALRLGHGSTGVVSIDLTTQGPHVLVIEPATTDDDHADRHDHAAVDAALIGACVDRPPDELEIVLLSGGATSPLLAGLPHVSVNLGHIGPAGLRRVIRSLAAEDRRRRSVLEHSGVENIAALHERGERRVLRRLLIVIERLDTMNDGGIDGLRSLIEVGPDVGIHIIVRTVDASGANEALLARFGAVVGAHNVSTGTDGGHATSTGRASLRAGSGRPIEFDPPTLTRDADPRHDAYLDDALALDGLSIRPFVIARDLTPMEKRLARSEFGPDGTPAETRSLPNDSVLAVLDALHAEAVGRPRTGVPPIAAELPDKVELLEFLRAHPGDGIPFALADAPDAQGHEPVWWLPGANASIAAYGVARSKMSALVPTLAIGASARLGFDDVRFHVICAETTALAPLADLPHTASLVSARARPSIEQLIDDLQVEVDRRLRLVRADINEARVAATETPVVVMVDDVGGCRRHLEGDHERDLWAELEHLLVRGQPVGVCTVMVARRSDEISARLAATIDTQLVSQLAANDDDHRFGMADSTSSTVPGRARRISDGVDLQIATLSIDLERVITEHAPDRARS